MFLYLIMMLQICLGNMSPPLSTQCAIARCSRCFSSTWYAHSLSQGLLKHPPLLPLTLMDSGWDDAELRAEVKALRRRVTHDSAPSATTLKTLKPLASRRTSAKKKKAVQAAMKARKKRRPYHTARATSLVDLQSFWQQAYTTWDGMFRPRVCHGGFEFEHDDFPDGVGIYLWKGSGCT